MLLLVGPLAATLPTTKLRSPSLLLRATDAMMHRPARGSPVGLLLLLQLVGAGGAAGGSAALPTPPTAYDDWHFPSEEPAELAAAKPVFVENFDPAARTVSISSDGGTPSTLAVGGTALNWTLRAVMDSEGAAHPPTAVLERNWARWGALVYLQEEHQGGGGAAQPAQSCSVAPRNPCVSFLRKGVGDINRLKRPRYALTASNANYFTEATTSTDDYLKKLFINITADLEPTFASAASVLPPTLDYALVKNIDAHSGFSVSPQGRVMAANFSIREQMQRGNAPLSPGGLLLFDPRDHLPFWPETNFSEFKSAMLGRFSRAVTVGAYDASSRKGFSLLAAPNVSTQSICRCFVVKQAPDSLNRWTNSV